MSKSEKKRKAALKGRTSPYWICEICAALNNWVLPKDYRVTVIEGLCGHCDRKDKTTLIPCYDFNGPNGKKAVWD